MLGILYAAYTYKCVAAPHRKNYSDGVSSIKLKSFDKAIDT